MPRRPVWTTIPHAPPPPLGPLLSRMALCSSPVACHRVVPSLLAIGASLAK
jgi:hypothetical protein